MLPGNVLFVVMLRADLTFSGLAYRLMAAWKNLYDAEDKGTVFLVTTKSLWEKMYGNDTIDGNYITLIDDRINYKKKALLLPLTVAKIIRKNKIKILHTNGNYLLLPIHYLKAILGIKTVVTFGSASIEMASTHSKYAARQWKLVLDAASAIDVLNPVNTIDGFRSKKFTSICSFPQRSNLNEYLHCSKNKKNIITYCGSLIPAKNPDLVLAAFNYYLRNSNDSFTVLHIFGKGPMKDEILKVASQINASQKRIAVVIEPTDQNMLRTLAQSRIFLSLMDYTNYPSQALMEAMLLGNDIIATNFGDTQFIVKEENGNILVSEKNLRIIGNAIEKLLHKQVRFNEANANFIKQNHNIDNFTAYLRNLYQNIYK